jgi:hypothetical protein
MSSGNMKFSRKKELEEQLDEVAEIAKVTPFAKSLQLANIIKFTKLLVLEPILGLAMAGVLFGAYEYQNDVNNERGQYFMLFASIFFFFILVVVTIRIILVAKYEHKHQLAKDKLELWKQVVYSQEAMRNGWVNNWGEMLKKKIENAHDLNDLILTTDVTPEEKIRLIREANKYIKDTENQFIELWKHIDSDMDEFQISINKALPKVELKQLDKLQDLYRQLDEVTQVKED